MAEIFKDIDGYEGLYQVSNHGRVKSLERPHNMGGIQKERILSPRISNGYKVVTLFKKGKRNQCAIHRLVLKTFSPTQNIMLQVNHIDGVKTNNHVSNLEWVTPSENRKHAYKIGLINTYGEKHPSNKLKEKDIYKIFELLKKKMKQSDIAKIFGISPPMVSLIKHRKNWSHIVVMGGLTK